MVDSPFFTVPVSKFIKHDVEKIFLENINMEKRVLELAEDVEKKKINVKDEIPRRRIDLVHPEAPDGHI